MVPQRFFLIFLLSASVRPLIAADADDTIAGYVSKSNDCVLAVIADEPKRTATDGGAVEYQCMVRVTESLVVGSLSDGEKKRVTIARLEENEQDRPVFLRKGGDVILFLNRTQNGDYVTADRWFGVQRHTKALAKAVRRVGGRAASLRGLSQLGRRKFFKTKPIESALRFVRQEKLDVSGHEPIKACASSYCPPQPTVYEWLVRIPAGPKTATDILIAVPTQGAPWRLDPSTFERFPSEE